MFPDSATSPISVESPVKAHLEDGSTVVFPKGVTIEDGYVKGQGFKYDITLDHSEPETSIALTEVAAIESYQTPVNTGATAAASTATTVGGGIGGLYLAKLVFGSCPTTYSLDNGEPVLEAESFSYSIAPGFETRDVDRLGIDPGEQDSVELEIRNEALETHYINHVELLEVTHTTAESVYPDPGGRPIVVKSLLAPDSVTDYAGRRINRFVGTADGKAWRTDSERLQNVSGEDMEDFVDLEFTVPVDGGKTALVLRLRNSLLNTVLLYEVMLKGQGFRALDWMAKDLDRLGPKYRLARWYRENMGMRVLLWNHGRYRQVATINDTGPIAWNEVAVPLPASKGGKVQMRLSFIADNWRIDQLALATMVRKTKARKIPVSRVSSVHGDTLLQAKSNLSIADAAYVITKPGELLRMQFDIGDVPQDQKRSYFLAAEGYYIEWMRKSWLESTSATAFVPNDAALLNALQLWEPQREQLRNQFESSKIRVR